MIESRGFPDPKVKLFHFIEKDKLKDVLQNGLKPEKPAYVLDSEIRKKPAVFCYLQPEDDLWGLGESDNYVLLQVWVDPRLCTVADQALFFEGWRWMNGGNPAQQNREKAIEFVKEYDQQALPLKIYRQGMLKSPEVLVRGTIPPGEIREK